MSMLRLSLVLTLFLAGGCAANPADDAPAATVQPAAATPAPAAAPAAPAPAAAPEGTPLAVAAGSQIEMVGSKVTGSHDIQLPTSGNIYVKDGAVTGTTIEFDMNNVTSDNERLTGHLKSDDFFDVPNHPTASFASTSIDNSGEQAQVTGNLTLRGTTNEITFPAEITASEGSVRVSAEFSIDRQRWGVSYPGKPDNLIRDDVLVRFELNAGS